MKFREFRLIDHCAYKSETGSAIKLLQENTDLDLTVEDGLSFIFAIKKDNAELLQVLIEYYKKNHLKEDDRDSMQYKLSLYILKNILERAEASYVWSDAIQKVLSPYVEYEKSDSSDVDDIEYDEDERSSYTLDLNRKSSIESLTSYELSDSSESSSSNLIGSGLTVDNLTAHTEYYTPKDFNHIPDNLQKYVDNITQFYEIEASDSLNKEMANKIIEVLNESSQLDTATELDVVGVSYPPEVDTNFTLEVIF